MGQWLGIEALELDCHSNAVSAASQTCDLGENDLNKCSVFNE